MLPTTLEIIRSGLKSDPTVTPADRKRILAYAQNNKAEAGSPLPPEARLVRRAEAARRLSCSVRTVDNLAHSGILRKRNLPGRVRASGFLETDLVALITSDKKQATLTGKDLDQ